MCDWPYCRSEELSVMYFDKELCDRHWHEFSQTEPNTPEETEALRKLGFRRTYEGVMPLEKELDNGPNVLYNDDEVNDAKQNEMR